MKDQIHNVDQVRQNLLDASLDVICAIDVHGRFITLNAASKAVWGYIPEELMGKRYIDYVVKKDIPLTDKAASEVMAGIEMTGFENSYVCKDGGIKPIIWSARWDKEAEIMYCVAKDATKIKINEKRLHRAYQLASIAWWEFDMATQTFTTSDEFYEIYGQAIPPNNQIKSEVLFSFVHPEDLPQVYIDMTSIGESNHINYEHRIIKPSGELAYLIHFTQVVRDSKGIPIALHGTTKDISIRKLQQLKIEESERSALHHSKRLSEILESIGDGFFTLDNDCKVTYWNAKAEMMLHKKREDILGKNIWEVYPETVHQKFYSEYHRAIQQNTPVHFEERNSKQIWYEVAAYPFIGGITVYFKDITQKKADENNVKRLSLVAEQTDNVVILTDAEQNITWVNRAFTQISEYSFDEALGKNPGQFLQGINTSSKTKAYLKQQIQNGEPFNCEIINYSKSGKEYWMHMKGQPIKNAEGKVEQFFAIQTDITERIELQKAIIDEKIAAQKEVSKAIISTQEKERSEIGQELHDNVNQILATIKLYIENIKSFPDHSKAFIDKSIALTQRAINEIRDLAKQLVTPTIADIGFIATLEEMTDHYRSVKAFEIQFESSINETLIDQDMQLTIYRILQEGLNNIVKYAKASLVTINIAQNCHGLRLEIKDDGIGFDLAKVSDGLGLKNIKNRAEVFKGRVLLNAAIGQGCCLTIMFPKSA